MTIDHTGIFVPAAQAKAVLAWYLEALKPLGYTKLRTEGPNEEVVGLSDNGTHADWWLITIPESPNIPFHHAFSAKGASVSCATRQRAPTGCREVEYCESRG